MLEFLKLVGLLFVGSAILVTIIMAIFVKLGWLEDLEEEEKEDDNI